MYVADYVLMEYGTGAIMAVPGHDERDFDFATEFGLPIRRVVGGGDGAALHGRRPAGELLARVRRPATTATRWRRSSTGSTARARATARSTTACATGCCPASATGAARSRSSTATSTASSRCPRTTCRSMLPDVEDYAPQGHAPRWPRPRTGSTRPARSAAARRGARRTRWTRSSTPPGTSCATRDANNDEAAVGPEGPRQLDAGRPVHRRRRARDPAPDVRALLREGAGRPGPAGRPGAVQGAVHAGHDHRATARRCPSPRAT